MTPQEIEAELSYAYLHAVASRAGVRCEQTGRSFDHTGIDAHLHATGDFGPAAKYQELALDVQLKATILPPSTRAGRLSYFLDDIGTYNRLGLMTVIPDRLLVVLFLPTDAQEWLRHTREQLVLKRCAYWVSLRGAPESENHSGQTVYPPSEQSFSPEGLREVFRRLAAEVELLYVS